MSLKYIAHGPRRILDSNYHCTASPCWNM